MTTTGTRNLTKTIKLTAAIFQRLLSYGPLCELTLNIRQHT